MAIPGESLDEGPARSRPFLLWVSVVPPRFTAARTRVACAASHCDTVPSSGTFSPTGLLGRSSPEIRTSTRSAFTTRIS